MPQVIVNGQRLSVPQGTLLLDAIRAAGVDLPTLCHHAGLAPYGACRLCMAAITAPCRALVAACVHPVEQDLEVETDAPEAVQARRLALEFLLSRCPQSEVLQALAAQEGVGDSGLDIPAPDKVDGFKAGELCVLCGLCVRVCREAIGASAISFVGRGQGRTVSTPFNVQSETCIGCGACAEICPTGAIQIEDRGSQRILHTWNTTVELHACPDCGRFFAPRPTAFLKQALPEAASLWGVCPDCRRRRTSRQWLEGKAASVV
jgi:bidirectional [NiFe] hydrogenase diaphorase subunit